MLERIMRLTAILTVIVLIVTAATARADDADAPKTVVFAVSSAESMTSVFGEARSNLHKSVDALAATDQVDVMFFSDGEPKKSSDRPVLADAAAKKKIASFIDTTKPSGKSNPVPTIKAALAMKPDVLYLLLDQVPDGDALFKAVKAADPDRSVRINIVFFVNGDGDPADAAAADALVRVVKFSGAGGQFTKILKSDAITLVAPVVFALSNSGSMLIVSGRLKRNLVDAVAALPPGTKFDAILFADGTSSTLTDAPVASDAKSKKAADDFVTSHPTTGHGEPVAGVRAALAMKPGTLYLTLDQVPDPAALTRAFETGDPKKTVITNVTFLTGNDDKKDKAAIAALDKIVKARHGTLTTRKESEVGGAK
jgi:hypothetical protein